MAGLPPQPGTKRRKTRSGVRDTRHHGSPWRLCGCLCNSFHLVWYRLSAFAARRLPHRPQLARLVVCQSHLRRRLAQDDGKAHVHARGERPTRARFLHRAEPEGLPRSSSFDIPRRGRASSDVSSVLTRMRTRPPATTRSQRTGASTLPCVAVLRQERAGVLLCGQRLRPASPTSSRSTANLPRVPFTPRPSTVGRTRSCPPVRRRSPRYWVDTTAGCQWGAAIL